VDEDVVRVERRHPEQTVLVFANRSAAARTVPLETPACDLATGRPVPAGTLDLPGRGIRALEPTGRR
jgi:hypothetical protein